jgi:hypothetical protein
MHIPGEDEREKPLSGLFGVLTAQKIEERDRLAHTRESS